MNLKNNKGITGIDLSVSLIIIVIFIGIIATLIYNFNISSKGINRTATATQIAISKIEELKSQEYESLQENSEEYRDENGVVQENAPYKVITEITKYADSEYVQNLSSEEKEKILDVIKIVKVTVEYRVGTKDEKVDISTVITKES